jgi:hypothetical protein
MIDPRFWNLLSYSAIKKWWGINMSLYGPGGPLLAPIFNNCSSKRLDALHSSIALQPWEGTFQMGSTYSVCSGLPELEVC